jgi:glycosyltransferase involved in cell wall biosynthesis
MPAIDTAIAKPAVSIIVPARNEEAGLGACLQSLLAQHNASLNNLAFEIIVVDDHSNDRTREIADSFAGKELRVIDAGPIPAGWTGKNNAVTAGARVARAEWLLFTDADTIHLPGSLARSLAEAKQHGAAMLSYSPEQIVETFSEKAVMPVIFAELAATFRPSQVSDPHSSAAAANGQYILITREAYDAVGGHGAVATSLLEDVALVRAVKQSGRKIFFRYGADAVRTRMYRDFAQLREGWTKNLALLFPSPVRLALLRAIEFALIVATVSIAIASGMRGRWRPAVIPAFLCVIVYAIFLKRIRRAHFSWDANVLALFGLPLFSYLLLRSKISHNRRRVRWKGRTYTVPDQSKAPIVEFDRSTLGQSGMNLPAGTKAYIGAPVRPMDEMLSRSIGKALGRIPEVREAHLPQMYIKGEIDPPAQVLVVVIEESAPSQLPQIRETMHGILPTGSYLASFEWRSNEPTLPMVQRAGCALDLDRKLN